MEAHYISAAVNYGRIVGRPSSGRVRAAEFVVAFAPHGVGSTSRQITGLDGRFRAAEPCSAATVLE